MTLELRVLGPPEVLAGGNLVQLETRKTVALLAYIAIEGPQRRDVLDVLLWPESDAKHARGALRRTLSAVRRALGAGCLADGGQEVGLEVDVELDLYRVEETLAQVANPARPEDAGRLRRLDVAHRGRFLEGFELLDAAPFERWRSTMEERVRRRHATVLERLCQAHTSAGDLGLAVEAAERRLALDPLHEPSHQQLMLLHTWRGDRARATAQYRWCVRVLGQELGVSPLQRTDELHRAILNGAVPEPRAARVTEATKGPARPGRLPVVGRDRALARLHELRAMSSERGRFLVVRGEAGIGKTRLLEEFAGGTEAAGGRTMILRAEPSERTVAYAPLLRPLLTLLSGGPELPDDLRREVGRLVPVAAAQGELPPLASAAARTRFVDAITEVLLRGVAGAVPGVLGIDDLDLADEETRELVSYLVSKLDEHRILVVASWRRGGEHERHVEQLLRRGTPVLDLERLGPDEVSELARTVGAEGSAAALYAESEGVPYLVVSYLAARTDDADWELPSSGRDLVRARLAPLSDVARQVLTAGAVLGRTFELATLDRVSGRGERELVDALDELLARYLLTEVATGDGAVEYAFTHDKIRVVVEDDTSLARRRLLHGRAADVLRHGPVVPAARLARHLAEAGRETEAALAHGDAGRHASQLYANAEAAEHLEAAVRLGHPDAAQVLVELGDVLVRLGRYSEAADRYTRAASRLADPAVAEHRLGALRLREGDRLGARTHLEAALQAGPAPDREALLRVDLALTHLRSSDPDAAASEAKVALDLAEASTDRRAVARARNLLAVISRRRGELEEAKQHLRASLQVVDIDDDERVAALNTLALVLSDAGEHDAAIVAGSEALESGRAHGDRHQEGALLNNLADVLHASGRTAEALDLQREAAEAFAGVGDDPAAHPEIWRLVEW